MFKKFLCLCLVVVALASCGGNESENRDATAKIEAVAQESRSKGGLSRESFILCPALQPFRDELASIVGFEQDSERPLAGIGMECIIHGDHGAFVRVAVPPAFVRSISMHAQSYDSKQSPATELAPDAVFVDAGLQPHVLFSMGSMIIDVDAESIETPTRDTMIQLAQRVREILAAANSAHGAD